MLKFWFSNMCTMSFIGREHAHKFWVLVVFFFWVKGSGSLCSYGLDKWPLHAKTNMLGRESDWWVTTLQDPNTYILIKLTSACLHPHMALLFEQDRNLGCVAIYSQHNTLSYSF